MAGMDELLRELTTSAKQRDSAFAAAAAPPAGGMKSRLMAIAIGTRVLDTITGEEGVVIDGKRENVVIPIASQPGS